MGTYAIRTIIPVGVSPTPLIRQIADRALRGKIADTDREGNGPPWLRLLLFQMYRPPTHHYNEF
jgi:hypothetical protein